MHRCTMLGMIIRRVPFDHPDAVKLNDEVQAEYSVRYGDDGDATFMDPAHFVPPAGLYLIAYDEHGSPLATGGWRTQDRAELRNSTVNSNGPASAASANRAVRPIRAAATHIMSPVPRENLNTMLAPSQRTLPVGVCPHPRR